MSQVQSHLSFAYSAGILGLSIASLFGLLKALDKYQQVNRDASRARSQLETMKRLLEERNGEIVALNQNVEMVREESEAKAEALRALQEEKDAVEIRMNEMRKQLDESRTLNRTLQGQLHQQTMDSSSAKDETQRLKAQNSQMLEVLKSRTSELDSAKGFLSKADLLSGTDVIGMVQALNGEICQTATFMADSIGFEQRGPGEGDAEVEEASARASEILGNRMVKLLRSTAHKDDPVLIQIAFQACMTAYCEWIIASWYFEDPQNERFLAEIYESVQKGESQTVSGRWRALTRTHVQRMFHTGSDVMLELIPHFVDSFVNVLLAAGCRGTRSHFHDTVVTRFTDRMNLVGRWALRLNKAVGEEIISAEVEAIYVPPEVIFDHSTMHEAFPKNSAAVGNKPVLCTTDLGLHRSVKISSNGESQWQETILLRPKVVLESGLQEMRKGSQDTL